MPFPPRLASALLAVLLLPIAGQTQQSTQDTGPRAARGSPDSRQITLNVVVTPKSGKPVTGLAQQDFTLLDNGAPQQITSFRGVSNSQVPTEIVLLIDAVNINYTNMAFERTQIEKFLKENGGHLAHPVTLAFFTDTGTQIQDRSFTDGNELSQAIEQSPTGLRDIRRSSQYQGEDRFNLSLKTMRELLNRESQRPGRKVIFWVSPGWPVLSGPAIDLSSRQRQNVYAQVRAISEQLRQSDITIYNINPLGPGESLGREFYYQSFLEGLKKPGDAQLGNLALQVLAVQSGGLALTAGNDVAFHLRQAMQETEAYYRITYQVPPAERPNEYRRIEVRVATPGLNAHTLSGYYAQP